jgi:uncharacterized protein (DUF1684 family)
MADEPIGGAAATFELADWRRQVADLYAEVRRLSATDVDAALGFWRATREQLYREHPQSPVPAAKRSDFRAHHFPADTTMRFEVQVQPDDAGDGRAEAVAALPGGLSGLGGAGGLAMASPIAMQLPVSVGGTMSFSRIGSVDIPFASGPQRLGVFWMAGYAGGLFVPFRDATNGTETYGAGRYLLDAAKSADLGGDGERGTLVLDFNFAYHPSCAFDPKWACPLAPPENRLDLPIRAGERLA